MIDIKELCKFLVKAKKSTYAAGDVAKKIMGSKIFSGCGNTIVEWAQKK